MTPPWDELNFFGPPGYPSGAVVPKMRPEGDGRSGIMVLAEALGEAEALDRLPLRPYAESGSVFERVLRQTGVPRDSLTIGNIVWYHPPRNWLDGAPWERQAIMLCEPLNDALVKERKPKVILALGGTALRELTGLSGEKLGIESIRGFIIPSSRYKGEDGEPIPVVGTYHPSFLRRGSKGRQEEGPKGKVVAAGGGTKGMALLGVLIRDLQLCQDIVREGPPKFTYDSYIGLTGGATLDDWNNFYLECLAHPEWLIVDDFETIDTLVGEDETETEHKVRQPTQIQMSNRPGQGIVSYWNPDLLPILRKIKQLPNPKGDWYGRYFDRPLWRELGVWDIRGELHDLCDCWHHAQPDLPRGLQFATSFFCPERGPWKHLSHSSSLEYGMADVDMPQRIFAGLRQTLSLIREPHSGVSLWGDGKYGGYGGQVVKLAPVLDRMSERGIPVDEDRRCQLDEEFSRTLGREQYQEYRREHSLPELSEEELQKIEGIADKIQSMVPDEIKSTKPANGYKELPRELTTECAECGGKKVVPNPAFVPRRSKGAKGAKGGKKKNVQVEEFDWDAPNLTAGADEALIGMEEVVEVEEVDWDAPTAPSEAPETLAGSEVPEGLDMSGAKANWRSKKLPCPKCGGKGRLLVQPVPSGWVQREFTDTEPCACSREAKRKISEAKRSLKSITSICQACGKPRSEHFPLHDARRTTCTTETFVPSSLPPQDPLGPEMLNVLHCPLCEGSGKRSIHSLRWARLEPFLLGSWQQIIRLIQYHIDQDCRAGRSSKWYIPTDHKTGRSTTSELELRRLATKTSSPLIPIILEYREISKLRGTYVQGWKPSNVQEFSEPSEPANPSDSTIPPDPSVPSVPSAADADISCTVGSVGSVGPDGPVGSDGSVVPIVPVVRRIGRVHPSFGFKPATGQLSSEDPCAQNFCQHSELAHKMKRMLVAAPGNVLVNFDYKSFHVLTLGLNAQDPLYMRMARNDMHSFFALAGLLQIESPEKLIELPDPELKAKLKWYRKQPRTFANFGGWDFERIRNEKAKRCIAEGQLVLTDQGEVPIENITVAHKVWDGIEWVSHRGVIYQGEREVIIYDGLTATPDHMVYTKNGQSVRFREAAKATNSYQSCPRTYSRVYDILDAGPRHRYTVAGRLVHNCILGIGFGQGARSLYMLNRESYAGVAEAQMVLDRLDELFPKPAQWRTRVRLLADEQHYLITKHGYIRRFWDVFSRRPLPPNYEPRREDQIYKDKRGMKWIRKPGDDHEACIALLCANDAFGTIRQVMVKLHEKGLDERYGMENQIHDSLVFDCPRELVDECLLVVKKEMEAPNLYLRDPVVAPEGLSCQVEAKLGPDMDSLSEVNVC